MKSHANGMSSDWGTCPCCHCKKYQEKRDNLLRMRKLVEKLKRLPQRDRKHKPCSEGCGCSKCEENWGARYLGRQFTQNSDVVGESAEGKRKRLQEKIEENMAFARDVIPKNLCVDQWWSPAAWGECDLLYKPLEQQPPPGSFWEDRKIPHAVLLEEDGEPDDDDRFADRICEGYDYLRK